MKSAKAMPSASVASSVPPAESSEAEADVLVPSDSMAAPRLPEAVADLLVPSDSKPAPRLPFSSSAA